MENWALARAVNANNRTAEFKFCNVPQNFIGWRYTNPILTAYHVFSVTCPV